jgi:FAD/FMN-containing dehydrogenase
MRALVLVALALAACGSPQPPRVASAPAWCKPAEPCWPTAAEWNGLRGQLAGQLVQPGAPADSANPFALQDDVAATQSRGWIDAWTRASSPYAVVATNASDVAAAVRFAAAHHVRIAIKGTGHDYLGRSSAGDALLIWTHRMRAVDVVDAFVPHGCAVAPVPAVSVGAGTRWIEAYRAVSVEHHRYVQGGGCTSVGVAGGFLQGGGFGSWSKEFGVAAASLLEAEVVTADGVVRIANACSEPDLFWALRGGGGGTFGVVTRVTLATYPLPETFGIARGQITAKSPEAFRRLHEHFLAFYRDHLDNEHWGESIQIRGDNVLRLTMSSQGLTQAETDQTWQPFRTWLATEPELVAELAVQSFPSAAMWNAQILHQAAPDAIKPDDREGGDPNLYWWTGDAEQVGAYWYAYVSRWIPQAMIGDPRLAAALFDGSRHWSIELHFNKGLAGGNPAALARSRETAVNPDVLGASALMITGAFGSKPALDRTEGEHARAGVAAAVAPLEALIPDAGSYANEGDYFERDWQRRFWGAGYARLLAIKHAYDPTNLFTCHHCVGSE